MSLQNSPRLSILRRAARAPRLALPLLLAACATAAPASAPAPNPPVTEAPLSASQQRWVESTLAGMTLRQKVGQLIMPWVLGDYVSVRSASFDSLAAWVETEQVGGVVMSIGMPLSYADKLNELQKRSKVPLLVASDMENGPGMRMSGIYAFPSGLPMGGSTAFPPVMALGATRSDSLAYALGRVLGEEARAVGVQLVFGPVLDVNSNPKNPIINTRSFGEDPQLVSELGLAYIRGAHDAGLMTTAKHFPGHGDAATDSHIGLPVIPADRARMDTVELVPFRAAVKGGIDAIMTAHIAVTGVLGPDAPPATLSPYFMTKVLRDEMGFEGVLFTDAMTMGGVAKRYGYTEPLILALEAGADVLLMPHDVHEAIETVMGAVQSGRLTEARIDGSVRRILEMKARAGLNEHRLVSLDAVDEKVATRAHQDVAREVARRSITLARDEQRMVPLPTAAKRVLSVTYADDADIFAGETFDAALRAGGLDVISVKVDDRTTPEEFDELRAKVPGVDAVIASAYVSPHEFKGSVAVENGFAKFVQEESEAGAPVVAVSFGSPYVLGAFPAAPAFLLAWGGQVVAQEAAAHALLGQAAVTGRLPVSLPPYFSFGDGIQRAAREAAK